MRLTLEFLGSGTSVGVPAVACECAVCRSDDPLNKRLRPAALVRAWDGAACICTVVLDTGPDFRQQMLRSQVKRIDAVIITHYHYDHIASIDDVRRFNHVQHQVLDCHGSAETLAKLRHSFGYIFVNDGSADSLRWGLPNLKPREIVPYEPFTIGPLRFEPLLQDHAVMLSLGFRISLDGAQDLAYCLDVKTLPERSLERLQGVDTLVLDMLREKLHPTHMNLDEALAVVERVRPRRAYFSHIAHEVDHRPFEARLPEHIRLAYDGLVLEL